MPGGAFVTCRGCGLTFDAGAGARPTGRPRREAPRPPPDLPPRLHLRDDGTVLTCWWPWRRWPAPLLGGGAAAIGWGGFAIGGVAAVAAAGALVAGVAGLAAAFAVNRTMLRVDPETITVSDRPIRLGSDQVFRRDDVQQLYVAERHWGRGGRYYALHAKVAGGDRPIAYLEAYQLARFLEQKVEERLGLVDVTVDAEVEPPS
jgi:hypothetical protein